MDSFVQTLVATIAGGAIISIPQLINSWAERRARREELYLQIAKDLAPLIDPHARHPDLKSILHDLAVAFEEIKSLDRYGTLTPKGIEVQLGLLRMRLRRIRTEGAESKADNAPKDDAPEAK